MFELADEVWKASLNPRPGREGIMSVNGCVDVGEAGSVRDLMSGVRERFVSGKVGIRSSGKACLCGDLMCRKWIRRAVVGVVVVVEERREIAVRY